MYAEVNEVEKRCRRTLSEEDRKACELLLEDAAVIIDSYGRYASPEAKRLVSCNMVVRALGNDDAQVPIGASQGTVSALGYSQTWTMGNGTTGEVYLTKLDKEVLGAGRKLAFCSPLENEEYLNERNNDCTV